MESNNIKPIVERAVQQAYNDWSVEHPSLAAVIDQVKLVEQTARSLRSQPEYAQAIEAYNQARNDLTLLNQLIELARPLVAMLLG